MTKPQETTSEKCRCSRGPFLLVHFSGKVFGFDSERPGTPVDSMETEGNGSLVQGLSQSAGTKGMSPSANHGNADGLATTASGPHLRQGDAKRKGADLLVAPLKLNVRLSKCGPRSVGRSAVR